MVTFITDIRVPAHEFPLGRILEEYPDVEIELEQLVPTQKGVIPLFWVDSESEGAVAKTLTNDPLVEDISLLTRTPDRILYSVDWSPDVDALVRTIVDLGIDVLMATGTADSWDFRLQFRKQTDLERFRRTCQRQDIDMELLELYNPLMPAEKGPLTSEQHDILATAYESGYWDVPRRTTQEELAELIGISDGLLSRRLREGAKSAIGELLFGPGGKPYE